MMLIVLLLLLILLAIIGIASGQNISLVFSLGYVTVALLPRVLRSIKTAFDPFAPYFGLSLLFFLYSLSTLQFVEANQISYNSEIVPSSALIEYVIACILGQFGLALGYLVAPRELWNKATLISADYNDVRVRLLLGPVLILALLLTPFYFDYFNFTNVSSYAEIALESRVVRMENLGLGIKDVLLRNAPSFILLCACTLILFSKHRRLWLIKFFALAVFSAYLITNLLAGARGQVVLGVLLPVMYFHYHVRKLPTIIIIFSGLLTYLLVNALSIMRSSADIGIMLQLLIDFISNNGLTFLHLSNSGELATSSNLLTLIIGIQNNKTDHSFGGLFLSQFGAFVPRAIWSERPSMASELFVQTFYPGTFESGGGYGLFFHQEGYWDFGLLGVVIYAAIIGWLTQLIYVKLIVLHPSSFSTLLYTALYGVLVLSVARSGLVGSIKAALMTVFPLLIVAWIARYVRYLRIKNF